MLAAQKLVPGSPNFQPELGRCGCLLLSKSATLRRIGNLRMPWGVFCDTDELPLLACVAMHTSLQDNSIFLEMFCLASEHGAHVLQDNETVLEHLVQQGQAQRALAVLRRPSTLPELHYKFAPALMAQARCFCLPSPCCACAPCAALASAIACRNASLASAPPSMPLAYAWEGRCLSSSQHLQDWYTYVWAAFASC